MLRLIQVPDVLGATPLPVYVVPESLVSAKLTSVSASFSSLAIGDLDIRMVVEDAMANVKGGYALPNVGAGHQASNTITWGGTGEYYLAVFAGEDVHHVPMQQIEIKGGDVIRWLGNSDPTGGWQGINLWVDLEELEF